MKFHSDILGNARAAYEARHEPEGLRRLSDFYWRAVLITAFLVLIFVFLYGIWGLLRVLNDLGTTTGTSTPPPPTLNRATLNATVREFELREKQFNLLKTTRGATVPDPSR